MTLDFYKEYEKELNDLDESDSCDYILRYEVRVVAYDEDDIELDYENILKDNFVTEQDAESFANQVLKESLTDLPQETAYIRINIVPVVIGNDFNEEQELEYSRVIIIKEL